MTSKRKLKPKGNPRQVIYYENGGQQESVRRAATKHNESISQFFLKAALRRAEATQ